MIRTRELYRIAVVNHLSQYDSRFSENLIDIIISVMQTRDNIIIGGSFAKSVCENDLYGCIAYGDAECIENLKIIVVAYHNCFI